MSLDDFYGRPLEKGYNALEFDTCEVCQRKSPQWLEAHFTENTPIIRFTCDTCHFTYEDTVKPNSPDFYTRSISVNEPSSGDAIVREGWVEEFINESTEAGSIQPIATTSESSNISFSEAPSSFQEESTEVFAEEPQSSAVAAWVGKYIQEALFGANPEQWLADQGAFDNSVIDQTLITLRSFVNHDNSSVKLSSIQCLAGVYKRHSSKFEEVKAILLEFTSDDDQSVKEFAEQTLKTMK